MATVSTFLKAIEAATQADLDAINEEIQSLEKQLGKRMAQRKMVEILLGVAPVKGKSGPRKKVTGPAPGEEKDDEPEPCGRPAASSTSGVANDKRLRIAKMLLNGSRRQAEIQEELDLPPQGFQSTINHEWFQKNGDGSIHLTGAGRAAATGKPQAS